MTEKLVRGVVEELTEAIPGIMVLTGFRVPGISGVEDVIDVLGYSVSSPDYTAGLPATAIDLSTFGGEITSPTLLVKRDGGPRFDPVFFSRVTLYSFAGETNAPNELALCWDIDNIAMLAMERLGAFRYRGHKFGSPVGESDGIPGYEENIKRWYVYRSFIITNVSK